MGNREWNLSKWSCFLIYLFFELSYKCYIIVSICINYQFLLLFYDDEEDEEDEEDEDEDAEADVDDVDVFLIE